MLVLQLVSVAASLSLPSLNADIIDRGIATGDTAYIWRVGGLMLAITVLQVCGSIGAAWCGAQVAMGFGRDVRGELFAKVGSFSAREMNTLGAPSLITRTTNDVQQVQQIVLMGATLMVAAPFMMIGGVAMALTESVRLSWLILAAVGVLAVAVALIVRKMVPGFRQMQARLDVVNRVMREHLSGVRVIRAFVREEREQQRFADANADLTAAALYTGRLMTSLFPVVMTVMNVSTVAVWWFGGHLAQDGTMQIGSVTAYMTYLVQILMSVMMATFMVMMLPRATVSAERITEVLQTAPSVTASANAVRPAALTGVVDFDQVSMTYPGADLPVLQDVSLHAEPGQTIAIIGSTGSGKSTLVSLVARLFDATAGQVLIDGVDVRHLDPEVLWGHIGIVPQRSYLFTGTIASNLRYGNPDANDADLWAALEIAQARDFVSELDGGLEAPVSQGGSNFSGGQRQRLCIARALVSRASIYLFDDSFSALDLATDQRLRAALRPWTSRSTVFLVAQRVSTIMVADEILVLDDGRVVGRGRHTDLLVTCPEYAEIVDSQLGASV
ncbi:ABC transporter ATP-binding protein [Calidifontibacter sp. DB0510]|uniref:ABC transporter ATP-binding protein n=1 Tax=Metallococcus carri TaxID=1656884 RepID=A0A967B8H3_9MICO|nr:ABC transporter ATP-binding protein [Metallococcus carri]NOP37897.1 ABC transporter ATP-binding protein [Calidifontibacter sp. DB2511S]